LKQVCNKCESNKLVFEKFEYCGEYASHDYLCLECQDQGTIYYDLKYTISNYKNENELKNILKKEET